MISELHTIIKGVAGRMKEYVTIKMDSIKLDIAEKLSLLLSNLISKIVFLLVLSFFLLFLNLAIAYALGEWLGATSIGFLIVAGFYLFVGLVIWGLREKLIRNPVMNSIISQLFKDEKKEMRPFKNIDELKKEQKKLEERSKELENVLCKYWRRLKGSCNPKRILKKTLFDWWFGKR